MFSRVNDRTFYCQTFITNVPLLQMSVNVNDTTKYMETLACATACNIP